MSAVRLERTRETLDKWLRGHSQWCALALHEKWGSEGVAVACDCGIADKAGALAEIEHAEAAVVALSNIEAMAYEGIHRGADVLAAIQSEASAALAAFGSGEGDTA